MLATAPNFGRTSSFKMKVTTQNLYQTPFNISEVNDPLLGVRAKILLHGVFSGAFRAGLVTPVVAVIVCVKLQSRSGSKSTPRPLVRESEIATAELVYF